MAADVHSLLRQVMAVAQAHLAGETDRVQALARQHLVDHPEASASRGWPPRRHRLP